MNNAIVMPYRGKYGEWQEIKDFSEQAIKKET